LRKSLTRSEVQLLVASSNRSSNLGLANLKTLPFSQRARAVGGDLPRDPPADLRHGLLGSLQVSAAFEACCEDAASGVRVETEIGEGKAHGLRELPSQSVVKAILVPSGDQTGSPPSALETFVAPVQSALIAKTWLSLGVGDLAAVRRPIGVGISAGALCKLVWPVPSTFIT
jgi:hypothetical protein